MKRIFLIFVFYSTFSFGKIKDFPTQPSRDWENINGNKINAQLLSFNPNTMNVKLQKNGEYKRIFWYQLGQLSSHDQEYVRELNKNFAVKNIYNPNFYENTPQKKWQFFDIKYCDVTLTVDYDELEKVPKIFNYDHKSGRLKNCILYLWDKPGYDRRISGMIRDFNFRPRGEKLHKNNKNFTDGILANIEVMHYLGLQPEDFKKLRWFFSAEDFAFYPEKIYKFLGILEKTSKKFDEEKLFLERHAKGIPIIIYWKNNGFERSRWCNFYNSTTEEEMFPRCSKKSPPKPKQYTKIIYLKTKDNQYQKGQSWSDR